MRNGAATSSAQRSRGVDCMEPLAFFGECRTTRTHKWVSLPLLPLLNNPNFRYLFLLRMCLPPWTQYTAFLWLLLETITNTNVVPPSFKPDREIECIVDKDLSEATNRIRNTLADATERYVLDACAHKVRTPLWILPTVTVLVNFYWSYRPAHGWGAGTLTDRGIIYPLRFLRFRARIR